VDLCATTGTVTMPGSVSVPVWGFVAKGVAADCSDVAGTATLPGQAIEANEGDVVTINVTNALPAGHTISIDIPGVSFDPGLSTEEAAVGATATVVFTADAAGTYLYGSGGDAGRQEAMGLSGALIVRSLTANQAYDDATTAYDVEATLVLSAIDPAFNADPDGFDMTNYLARYWLINGEAYPDTDAIVATDGQRLLLRYVNAGFDNTSMALLGTHQRVLARDANLLNNPFDAVAETIPAGGTEDTIVTIPGFAPPSSNGFALYNRNLHVTNGGSGGSYPYSSPGGMLTFIQP
jgi:FtsP/CotA-like multicopper oxidase with cupredoxin domain